MSCTDLCKTSENACLCAYPSVLLHARYDSRFRPSENNGYSGAFTQEDSIGVVVI